MLLHHLVPGPAGGLSGALWRVVLLMAEVWVIAWGALAISTALVSALGPSCYVDWRPVGCD